ncbi:MAG: hypothetical protein M3Z25_03480 [Actinomycetota bacterium]|nr:hypothetical protein [Actinomycetota bacterium]
MSAVRITLSVPEGLADRIKKASGEGTVSGWVVKVIEEYFAEDEELERQFDEWLDAHPVDEEIKREVDAVLEKALGIRRERGAA